MTFGAPLWFWAVAILPALLALFFWNEQRRVVVLQKLVAARLLPELAASVSAAKRRFRFFILLTGLACVIVALARPQLGYTWQQTKRKGRDVLIAIDTSKSMLATDLAPNRLTRAKLAAQDLINLLPGDRVGLIAFAGGAFLQAPLTIDYSAALSAVNELDTNIIPRGGTDIAAAINAAAEAFGKGESENRALILMTDGEELDENGGKAAREHAHDFRIFTVGIGSKEGSLIPVPGEDGGTTFVKDEAGQIVKSRLDETRLSEIAEATGGFYVPLQGTATMKEIVEKGLAPMRERDIDTRNSREPIERYQWPLALGLALLAWSLLVGERKRVRTGARRLAVVAILLLSPCSAFSTNNGVELYGQQNYKGALDEFQKQLARNPKSEALQFDAGTAAYKLGDYDKALEAFGKAVTTRDADTRAKAEYNLGNTLFQRGTKQEEKEPKLREWRNALQHYDQALKLDPKDGNAKTNQETVRKLIEELEKEKKQEQQQKQDEKKDQEKKKDEQNKENQQPQSGQKDKEKEQPKEDQKQQQKSEQSKDQQSKNGEQKKEEQSPQNKQDKGSQQDQQQQKPSESGKEEEKQAGEKQDQNSKPDQQQKGGDAQQKNAQAANSPAPAPTPGEKLSGEIKPQSSEQKPAESPKSEPVQIAPEKPGEMSEAQARALIDSLRGDDQRVQLNERQRSDNVLKDW